MQDIRKVLCWLFAFESMLCFLTSLWRNLYFIHRQFGFLPLRNQLTAAFSGVLAIVFAVAWWTIWKGKQSARWWGIAASLAYVLIFLQPIIFPSQPVWDHHVGALSIGIVGLVVFSRSYEMKSDSDTSEFRKISS